MASFVEGSHHRSRRGRGGRGDRGRRGGCWYSTVGVGGRDPGRCYYMACGQRADGSCSNGVCWKMCKSWKFEFDLFRVEQCHAIDVQF